MKTAYKNLEYIKELSPKKGEPSTLKNIFQLLLNLAVIYMGSQIYIDVWRSFMGH
jgi:hypothetical protein